MHTEVVSFVIDSGAMSVDAEQSTGFFSSIRQIVVPTSLMPAKGNGD